MDRVILLYFRGSVSEQFELVGMRPHVLIFEKPSSFNGFIARVIFEKPPSFNGFIARVRAVMNVECDLRLHGRYDMGSNRPIHVMVHLGSEDEW
jgi:hypothetical protein